MMSSRDDSIANDENRSDSGIRARLTERFLCLVECRAHELFISCSIHRFDRRIVVLACRGNAGFPRADTHPVIRTSMQRLPTQYNGAHSCLEGFEPPTF